MKKSNPFFFIFSIGLLNAHLLLAQQTATYKKLIHLGWELTTPQIVKANYKNMEATAPFDGITFILRDTLNDKTVITEGSVFNNILLQRSSLQKSIADIKSCAFTQFKNNFIRVNTVPGNLKWTDDAAWAVVAKNMGTMAWFAKQAGLVGICYDPESYGGNQFMWNEKLGMPFADTKVLAKQRGKQIMTEIGKEYPDLVFWGLFLLSFQRATINSMDIEMAMMNDKYGLYPAFIDGLLEALPPTAKMVEGNEDAYYSRNRENLLSIYNDSKVGLPALLSVANKVKYQAQVSIGLGLYTDMYTNKFGSRYYFSPTANSTRLERFRDRIQEAMEITDEYVWLYNEDYKWWDIPFAEERFDSHFPDPLINNKMPGILESSLYAKNPLAFIKNKMLQQDYAAFNVVTNPGFEKTVTPATEVLDWTNKDCPTGYLQWRPENSKYAITTSKNAGVNNSACAIIVGDHNILIQQVAVKPGEKYIVSVDGKKTGGRMILATRFMDEGLTHFSDWNMNRNFSFTHNANNQWNKAIGLITVPENIYSLQLLLEVSADSKEDTFYFDNLFVVHEHHFFNKK